MEFVKEERDVIKNEFVELREEFSNEK